MTPDSWRDDATVIAYKAASVVANLTPGPLADFAAASLGWTFSQLMVSKRSMVQRHMRRALGPDVSDLAVRSAAHHAFESYARYWVESFRLPQLSAERVRSGLDVTGWEHIQAGLDAGNGVIVLLAHLGGWEWAGRWVADRGIPITVVVEPVQPPEMFEWFRSLRTELGMNVVPLGPTVGTEVLAALKANHIVCLLADRDLEGNGLEVEFFGERTRLPAGPATLAVRTGAPIVPVGVYFKRGTDAHDGIIRPAIDCTRQGKLREDIGRITQLVANELEVTIRHAPEQWHLFQPNWPSDPGYKV